MFFCIIIVLMFSFAGKINQPPGSTKLKKSSGFSILVLYITYITLHFGSVTFGLTMMPLP